MEVKGRTVEKEREQRVEKENELERRASLDSERQAVAVYQGHF